MLYTLAVILLVAWLFGLVGTYAIPLDLDGAVHVIAAGHRVAVDVGDVNGRVFVNNSSLGLYPDMVRDRERQRQRLGRGRWAALAWASITMLRRYPFLDVVVSIHGHSHWRRTAFVFIGNNEYAMEGFDIGTRLRLNGGTLSVYVTQRCGRAGLLLLALRALVGRMRQARDLDALVCHTVTIGSRHRRLCVANDGEVVIERMTWAAQVGRFLGSGRVTFRYTGRGWSPLG